MLVVKVVMPGDDYEEDETQEPATGENWQRETPNKGPKARVEILKRINHQGEVNRWAFSNVLYIVTVYSKFIRAQKF